MLNIPELLTTIPYTSMVYILMIGIGRPVGALVGLWGMYYVLGPAMFMRTIVGAILALPIISLRSEDLLALVDEVPRLLLFTLPVKEFFIGFSIGLLASLPFFAVLGAAVIVDQYRGDASPSNPGPEQDQIGTFAVTKVVISLFLFTELGGFMILIAALYESYTLVPFGPLTFGLPDKFAEILSVLLQNILWLLVIVALPVMTMLFLIEIGVGFMLRMSKGIELPAVEFLLKGLVFTLALPVIIIGVVRTIEATFDAAPEPIPLMREFIGDE